MDIKNNVDEMIINEHTDLDSIVRFLLSERSSGKSVSSVKFKEFFCFNEQAFYAAITNIEGAESIFKARGKLSYNSDCKIYHLIRDELSDEVEYRSEEEVFGVLNRYIIPGFASDIKQSLLKRFPYEIFYKGYPLQAVLHVIFNENGHLLVDNE